MQFIFQLNFQHACSLNIKKTLKLFSSAVKYIHSLIISPLKYGINSQAYPHFKAEDMLYNIPWFSFMNCDQVICNLVICPLIGTADVSLHQTALPLCTSNCPCHIKSRGWHPFHPIVETVNSLLMYYMCDWGILWKSDSEHKYNGSWSEFDNADSVKEAAFEQGEDVLLGHTKVISYISNINTYIHIRSPIMSFVERKHTMLCYWLGTVSICPVCGRLAYLYS